MGTVAIAGTAGIRSQGCVSVNGNPDHACTPGSIDPRVTQANIKQTICVSGYTSTVRPPVAVTNKIKTDRMKAYGYTDSPTNYELDHLISLEIGGNPSDPANLWPEPYHIPQGAHQKDQVENLLHKRICSGQITLQEAQKEISNNWEGVK